MSLTPSTLHPLATRWNSSERQRPHPGRAGRPQRPGAGVKRRPGRDDVIDQDRDPGHPVNGHHPRRPAQPARPSTASLPAQVAAAQGRCGGQAGSRRHRQGDLAGRIEAPSGEPQRRGRDRYHGCAGEDLTRCPRLDQRRCKLRRAAKPAELECRDETPADAAVGQRREPGVDPVGTEPGAGSRLDRRPAAPAQRRAARRASERRATGQAGGRGERKHPSSLTGQPSRVVRAVCRFSARTVAIPRTGRRPVAQSKTIRSTAASSGSQPITGGALPSAVSGSLRPCPVRTQTTVSGSGSPAATGSP